VTIMTSGGVMVKLHSFFISALGGGGWLALSPSTSLREKYPNPFVKKLCQPVVAKTSLCSCL
jgi:hypothetical protein